MPIRTPADHQPVRERCMVPDTRRSHPGAKQGREKRQRKDRGRPDSRHGDGQCGSQSNSCHIGRSDAHHACRVTREMRPYRRRVRPGGSRPISTATGNHSSPNASSKSGLRNRMTTERTGECARRSESDHRRDSESTEREGFGRTADEATDCQLCRRPTSRRRVDTPPASVSMSGGPFPIARQ